MATTNITLSVDNSILATAVAALAYKANWSATLPDGSANPQTQAQAAKAQLITYTEACMRDYQAYLTAQQATTATTGLIS